jgi:hypothetical protein
MEAFPFVSIDLTAALSGCAIAGIAANADHENEATHAMPPIRHRTFGPGLNLGIGASPLIGPISPAK